MNPVVIAVIFVVTLLILAFCRAVVMWWLGTGEIVKLLKQSAAREQRMIELLEQMVITDMPPAAPAPPAQRQPVLTSRRYD